MPEKSGMGLSKGAYIHGILSSFAHIHAGSSWARLQRPRQRKARSLELISMQVHPQRHPFPFLSPSSHQPTFFLTSISLMGSPSSSGCQPSGTCSMS